MTTKHPDIYWQTRDQLPHLLNSCGLLGVGVEVGVQWAQNFHHIRTNWKGAKLIGVDAWAPYFGADVSAETHEHIYQSALDQMRRIDKSTWEFMRMTSLEAASKFDDAQLDFVYLDGDHDYAPFLADLKAWWPKVKPGGVVAGHDWIKDGWHLNEQPFEAFPTKDDLPRNHGGHCGPFFVRAALNDFLPTVGANPDALRVTSPDQDRGWQSWLIVKG